MFSRIQAQAPFDPDFLRTQIAFGVRAAGQFGLVQEPHVASFIETTALLVPGGFSISLPRPLPVPALSILLSHGLDPDLKLGRYRRWADSLAAEDPGVSS